VFFGGVLPWLVGWMVYSGHRLLDLLSWTGLILNGFIDFFAPALVALVAVKVMCAVKVHQKSKSAVAVVDGKASEFGTFVPVPNREPAAPAAKANGSALEENNELAIENDGLADVTSLSEVAELVGNMWRLQTPVPPTIANALSPTLVPYHAKVVIVLIVAATLTVFVGLYLKISATIHDIQLEHHHTTPQ
jgi:hypothetical protein